MIEEPTWLKAGATHRFHDQRRRFLRASSKRSPSSARERERTSSSPFTSSTCNPQTTHQHDETLLLRALHDEKTLRLAQQENRGIRIRPERFQGGHGKAREDHEVFRSRRSLQSRFRKALPEQQENTGRHPELRSQEGTFVVLLWRRGPLRAGGRSPASSNFPKRSRSSI